MDQICLAQSRNPLSWAYSKPLAACGLFGSAKCELRNWRDLSRFQGSKKSRVIGSDWKCWIISCAWLKDAWFTWFPENTAFANCLQAGLDLNFGMWIGATTLKWSLPADTSVHISQWFAKARNWDQWFRILTSSQMKRAFIKIKQKIPLKSWEMASHGFPKLLGSGSNSNSSWTKLRLFDTRLAPNNPGNVGIATIPHSSP